MKMPNRIKRACQVLRQRVRYDGANFDRGVAGGVTEQIKRDTQQYVETWIVPLINAIETGDMHRIKTITERERGHQLGRPPDQL